MIDIEKTADGSATLYRQDLDEHYHSVKGALAESNHVYLDLGWRFYAESHPSVRVFEVGFGTGLNAALTAQAAEESGKPTSYFSVELYPLTNELTETLATLQSPELAPTFIKVNEAAWYQAVEINPDFQLTKIEGDLLTIELPDNLNVVYFDAFAPEKQPEMWSEGVFRKIFDAMSPGGVLTTYCAKGVIRRLLESTGFMVERLPGPPAGKREVLRAGKPL